MVTKATTEGLQVQGMQNKQRFTQQFVSEALILSDLFDMDELAAVELLMAGREHLTLCLFVCLFAFCLFCFVFGSLCSVVIVAKTWIFLDFFFLLIVEHSFT